MSTQAIPIPSDATIGKAIPIPSDATIGQAFSSPAAAIASGASPEAIQSATQQSTKVSQLKQSPQDEALGNVAAVDSPEIAKSLLKRDAQLVIGAAPAAIPGVGEAEGATLLGQVAKGSAIGAGVGAVTHAGGAMVAGHLPTAKGIGEAAATGAVIVGVASPLLRLAKVSALIRQIPGISKYLPQLEDAGLAKTEEFQPFKPNPNIVKKMGGNSGSYDPVAEARASVNRAMKRPATMAPLRPTPISEQAVGSVEKEAGYQPPVVKVPFKGGTQPKVTYEQVPGPDTAGKGNLLTPAAKRGEAGAGAELTRRGRVVLHEGQPDVGRPRTVIHFDENQMPVIEHIHGEPTIEQIEPETGHNGSSPENPVSRESISAKQKFRITDSKGNVINPNVSAHDARGGLVKVGKGRTVQVWEPTLKRWIDF